jgi:hypothetical protein
MKLATGGPPGSRQMNLWCISASATDGSTGQMIDYTNISIGGLGNLDTNGNLWVELPDNNPPVVTPTVKGNNNNTFSKPAANEVFLRSLTVVSNSATEINATNWACVKSATDDWVYLQATLSTDDTNAAQFIQWSGGQAVPSNPFQHRVKKIVSAKTTVTATLSTNSFNQTVWVLWATIDYNFSGSNPSPLLFANYGGFPDEVLGIELYQVAYWGKMCAMATVTPVGAHQVVSNGWNFVQSKQTMFFVNGIAAGNSTYPNWAGDTTPETSILDSNDRLYLIDAPNLPSLNGATSDESYQNFRNVVLYGSTICTDTNYFWHWQARQATSVDATNLGSGMILISTNSYYQ